MTESSNMVQSSEGTVNVYRPKLRFTRANAKGTGSSVTFELHPAHDDTPGSLFMTFANQKTIGSRTGNTVVYPSFDWQNSICVKMDLIDLAQMLMVFQGVRENIADGKGLFHQSSRASTIIKFEHRIEPVSGYLLEVSRRLTVGDIARSYYFFNMEEAWGFSRAVEMALPLIAFGKPLVIPRPDRARALEGARVSGPVDLNDPF